MRLLGIILAVPILFLIANICNASKQEVLLEESFTFHSGDRIKAHNDRCKLSMHRNGNIIVERYDTHYDEYKVTWKTGPFGTKTSKYTAILESDGAFKIWKLEPGEHQKLVYSTVRFVDPFSVEAGNPYQLVMDEDCDLSIVGDMYDEYDNETYKITVWSNIRRYMTNTDVMQRGDILTGSHYMESCYSDKDYSVSVPMHIMLEHDCDLRQRVGRDMADRGDVVWDAKAEIPKDIENCYVYVDKDFVGLYEGTFDVATRNVTYPERKGLLWSTERGNWEETELHDDNGFYAD